MFRVTNNASLRRSANQILAKSREQWLTVSSATLSHKIASPLVVSHTARYSQRHCMRRTTTGQPLIGKSASLIVKQHFSPTSVHVGAVSYFSSRFPGGGRGSNNQQWMRNGAGLMGAGAMLFGKGKYLLGALKLTKLASLGSMVLTVGTYSMFFGLPYAAGMVGLITVHEAGHALVMYQRGIDFSPMVFMPFMGAMITMNRRPRDAWEDALVAFGGPVLGSIGAAGVAVGAHMTQSQLLFALADFGFMVNLFNLLPLGSMDGGRIAGALTPWMNVAGLGAGGALALTGAIHNPIFYIILLGGGWDTYQKFFNPGAFPPNYYRISTTQRGMIGAGYLGLIASLALAMDVNERFKKPPEVLIRERDAEKYWDMR